MRVDVLGGVEHIGAKKTAFQPIGVYYPSKRLPVEDKLFLQSESEQLAVGSYTIDVEKCLEPDSQNNNRAMLWIRARNLVPVPVARPQPSASVQSAPQARTA